MSLASLRQHLALQEVAFDKHGRVNQPPQLKPFGKLFFISLRDPLREYQSLYAFGVRYKGTPLRMNLARVCADLDTIYDGTSAGFAAWMDILCSPEMAPDLAQGYTPDLSRLIGLQSFRFLSLSFFEPPKFCGRPKPQRI